VWKRDHWETSSLEEYDDNWIDLPTIDYSFVREGDLYQLDIYGLRSGVIESSLIRNALDDMKECSNG